MQYKIEGRRKTVRRIKALLLLAGLLLTMTACSREVQPRYFDHVNDAGFHTYACVQGNSFSVGYFDESEAFEGSCTLQEDGSYMLDMFVIPMRLTHFFGDFYVLTVDEQTDAAFACLSDRSIVRQHDESSFTIYVRDYIRCTITRDGGKTVAMVTMTDYWSEEWA